MNRNLLGIVALIAVGMTLIVGLAVVGSRPSNGQTLPVQTAPVQMAQAPAVSTADLLADRVLGNPNAPVTILDYSSMTCPHCAAFHTETLPKIKEAYIDTGKAKLIFRDFPFDQTALRASMLARCAPAERYYPLLDVLFKSQGQWSRAADPVKALAQLGKLAGMSEQTISACMANQALENGILQSRLVGQDKYKVEATPTFVLNEGAATISGAQSFETFAAAIDKLVK
ncbi:MULTISPECIES: DsbA family protein [Azospirillum]|uniref:DsbA family protein n=1 Tax=Azospirillum brasilense TaxID=192 RepID=A0ABU4P4T6_AZOBR|nr:MULTISPECIES: DsbA family protein [Azospirillum]MDW7553813.1 DsbA family protein [Azospirillum brasilense]MDW7592748.1 DsbA family protein [Azospirillum brasilense]MDW7628279.1 DsbA family protein [Azospirillum brasilense]MDX5952218.1 DsbA family protein [Azospirillum brasilense]TVZ54119.1 protein-disulfide isomerase [Azospirillum brasilense]